MTEVRRRKDGTFWVRFEPGRELGPYRSLARAVLAKADELEFQVRKLRRLLENHMCAHGRPGPLGPDREIARRLVSEVKGEGDAREATEGGA